MKKKTIKKPNVRLVGHVSPERYTVMLKPDLEAHVFEGDEVIAIQVDKPIQEITLHSKDLDITSATVTVGTEVQTGKVSYNDALETATFTFEKKIPKGSAQLALVFRGVLADNMRGFYKSKYMVDNEERFMATTQFEATDARRCIPCFDEPSQKAVFDIHLVVPSNKTAISNTLPVMVKEHEAGYKIVSFESTPKMSTYLLAFIVGDFDALETKTKSGVAVRVLTVPGKSHQAKFALDVTARCLEFYEDYFDIPYPLNTLDMIAIPDFSSLAMENWGAITFREIGLLVDEENTSTATKEMVAEVIAHELAHQWFGNLVTMEWWTHLWLNEGFASYVPYIAMEHMFPEWNMWEKFSTDTLAMALKLDALRHTHPIEVDVHDPNEIGEIFDAVSYHKGASVIRMLAEYIGDKHFRDGLRHYLKKHSYKNASTIHLWESFEKVSKKPVKKMMAAWTGKEGYPVVSVEVKNKKLNLSQTRFYSSEVSAKKSKDTSVWPVPISVVTPKGEKMLSLMTTKKAVLPAPVGAWYKLNAHEGSVYRVKYDAQTLMSFVQPIQNKEMAPADRLGIIRDLFILAEAGHVETSTALAMVEVYKKETAYIVWIEIVSGLRYIANLLYGSASYESFRAYAREILSDIVAHVGWDARENESHDDSLLRPLILGAASFFGNGDVAREAVRRFANRDDEAIHADLRGVVYATIAREGGENEYASLLALYMKETLHEEKNRLLGALGQFKQKKLLSTTLEFTMTDAVRMQDRNGAFASVLVNPYGREIGWKFLKKNWKKIGEAYGDGNHLLSRLVAVLNRNTTKEAFKDIKEFFKTHSAPSAERTIDQTLENIESNIRWLARDGKKIDKWFTE